MTSSNKMFRSQPAQLRLLKIGSGQFGESMYRPVAACNDFTEGEREPNMKRWGIILCMVSALVTMASVVTIAARFT